MRIKADIAVRASAVTILLLAQSVGDFKTNIVNCPISYKLALNSSVIDVKFVVWCDRPACALCQIFVFSVLIALIFIKRLVSGLYVQEKLY